MTVRAPAPSAARAGLLLLALTALSACGGPQRYVRLADIDPALARVDDPRLDAFHCANAAPDCVPAQEASRVPWVVVCGPPSQTVCTAVTQRYQAVFDAAALAIGTLAELRHVIEGIASGRLTMRDAAPIVELGARILLGIKPKAEQLVATLKSLDPKADFQSEPLLGARVASALPSILSSLAAIPAQVTEIAGALEKNGVALAAAPPPGESGPEGAAPRGSSSTDGRVEVPASFEPPESAPPMRGEASGPARVPPRRGSAARASFEGSELSVERLAPFVVLITARTPAELTPVRAALLAKDPQLELRGVGPRLLVRHRRVDALLEALSLDVPSI